MRALIVCILVCIVFQVQAQYDFKEGVHYTVVAEQKTPQPEVKEFFSLYCGHCFQYEPYMDSLSNSLPNGLELVKSHVSYLPKNNAQAQQDIMKAFMAMRKLGKEKELVRQFFAAIHVKQMTFESMADIKKIFLANGVSSNDFDALMNNTAMINEAEAMAQLWLEKQIQSVPTLVVNGKYRVNMDQMRSMDMLRSITLELLIK